MPRAPWDRSFKQFFGKFFSRLGITPLTEYPVAQEALTIDVVLRLGKRDLEKLSAVTPFSFFRVHNLIEFKSPRDPLNLSEYRLIIGRVYIYLSQRKEISRHQVWGFNRSGFIGDGMEGREGKEGKRFHSRIFRHFNDLRLTVPQDVRRFLKMSRPFRDFPPLEENIRFFIKDFGLEKILSEMTIEDLQELKENDRKRLLNMLSEIEAGKSENTQQNASKGQQEK